MNVAIHNAIDEYAEMIKTVKADSTACKKLMQYENQHQTVGRILVSSIFRGVEGILNTAGKLTEEYAKYHDEHPELIAKFQEKKFKKSSDELFLTEVKSFLPLQDRVKLIYSNISKYRNLDINIDYSKGGGAAFLKAITVRNRITHPKNVAGMRIQKQDMINVQSGFVWFMKIAASSCK